MQFIVQWRSQKCEFGGPCLLSCPFPFPFTPCFHFPTFSPRYPFCPFSPLIFLYTLCLQKNIPNIFNCNLKTNYQILIIFGTYIPDATCHQMTIQFPTSPNFCFCTNWGNHDQQNITFYPMRYDCLINITCKNTFFVHISDTLADISSSCPFFNCLQ